MCGEKKNKADRKPSRRSKSRIAKLEQEKELLESKLKEAEEKNVEYLNQLRYLKADYENFSKRTEREIEKISKYGNERLITELLEILDELELASAASENDSVSDDIKKGIQMILEKFLKILGREGVTVIESENKKFDPEMHQAISKEYSKKHEEGTVLREVRKGYLLKGKVIRPSTVVVSSSKANFPEE